MDTLRSLIALLLLSPALASASTPSNCVLYITSGSILFEPNGGPFFTSGPSCGGFTMDGDIFVPTFNIGPIGPDNSFPYGGGFGFSWTNTNTNSDYPSHLFTLIIHDGVPWDSGSLQASTGAGVEETHFAALTPGPINHPGTYRGTFTFNALFVGLPAGTLTNNCNPPDNCISWDIQGSGTALFNVVDSNQPGGPSFNAFSITEVTGAFEAPEPSTVSLLLVGVAGLAILARRRRPRAT